MLTSEQRLLAEIAKLRAQGWENCPQCDLLTRRVLCPFCALELLGISLSTPRVRTRRR